MKVKFQGGQIREIDIFLGSEEHKTLATSPGQVIAFAKAAPGYEEDSEGVLHVPFSDVGPYLSSTNLVTRIKENT
jgi:hypothetical protein